MDLVLNDKVVTRHDLDFLYGFYYGQERWNTIQEIFEDEMRESMLGHHWGETGRRLTKEKGKELASKLVNRFLTHDAEGHFLFKFGIIGEEWVTMLLHNLYEICDELGR